MRDRFMRPTAEGEDAGGSAPVGLGTMPSNQNEGWGRILERSICAGWHSHTFMTIDIISKDNTSEV